MLIKSFAKINLFLKIGKKLPSGYHEIESVMQQVNLSDELSFKKIDEDKVIIKCNIKELENKNNIAYKAAELVKNKFDIKEGIEINIEKNIPIGAGLAGGSGNAAVTLNTMNKLFNLNLGKGKLIEIGKELGSDVPFQILGKTVLVEGTGEKLTKLNNLKDINIVLVNPGINISTKWAYEEFDKINIKKDNKDFSIKKLISIIETENSIEISKYLYNDFELMVFDKYPKIKKIKQDLLKGGALNALMSGSGSSVFGIFEDKAGAEKAYKKFKDEYSNVFLLKTV